MLSMTRTSSPTRPGAEPNNPDSSCINEARHNGHSGCVNDLYVSNFGTICGNRFYLITSHHDATLFDDTIRRSGKYAAVN